jgi:hypothetical protein
MILSGFSPVKANWWITFGMGADTKKKDNKKSQGGGIFFCFSILFLRYSVRRGKSARVQTLVQTFTCHRLCLWQSEIRINRDTQTMKAAASKHVHLTNRA